MISKKNRANLFLIISIFSAVIFYFYFLSTNKGSISVDNIKSLKDTKNVNLKQGMTMFTNVEYRSSDEKNRSYITTGKEAYISKSKPDLIELKFVHSYTKLKDGSTLNIKSNKAKYFKNTQNIEYYESVSITNKDNIITAQTANFLKNKNKIKLENNVVFKNSKNTIKGDIAELNTVTNDLKVFMSKKKDKVYGQRKQ